MCLAIPGRIVSIDVSDPAAPVARVDYGAVQKSAHLLYVPDCSVGDYVIVHAGFATRRLSPEEAREAMELREEMVRAAGSSPPLDGRSAAAPAPDVPARRLGTEAAPDG